jgi:hypothetical protein
MKLEIPEMAIRQLQFLAKTYDGLNKLITSTKNRLHAINPDADQGHDSILNGENNRKGEPKTQGLEQIKSRIGRDILKELVLYPIYERWLKHVPGCGPYVCSNLILAYYFRFVPICHKCGADYGYCENGAMAKECPKCQAKAQGGGLLETRIERKEFINVSKWWKYMGRSVEDGKMPKRKKGVKSTWSSKRREVGYQLSDQFNRQKPEHKYKAYLLKRREKRLTTHPKASKGHNLNMAKNESLKLFLAHFWHVARELEGESTAGPYAVDIQKHSGIIAPYYWEPNEG